MIMRSRLVEINKGGERWPSEATDPPLMPIAKKATPRARRYRLK